MFATCLEESQNMGMLAEELKAEEINLLLKHKSINKTNKLGYFKIIRYKMDSISKNL